MLGHLGLVSGASWLGASVRGTFVGVLGYMGRVLWVPGDGVMGTMGGCQGCTGYMWYPSWVVYRLPLADGLVNGSQTQASLAVPSHMVNRVTTLMLNVQASG